MKAGTGIHRESIVLLKPNVSKDFPLENIHMSKANDEAVTKIRSVEWIKPSSKNNKKVVRSLEEWAAKNLCPDNKYVKNKAKADDKMKKRFNRTTTQGTNQYAMMEKNYKPTNRDTRNSIEICQNHPCTTRTQNSTTNFFASRCFHEGGD
jgi:hypothetical protein